MAYRHGIYGSEVPTSIIPPTRIEAGLPVIFGTAPVHLAKNEVAVNKPVLCYTYQEAVEAFGYSNDWDKYTLSEVMYSQFSLFAVSPIVFINVLDVDKHKQAVEAKKLQLENKEIKIKAPVIISSLVVKTAEAAEPLKQDIDYTAIYNDDEELVITALEGAGILDSVKELYVSYDEVDASLVTKDDIIGGIDLNTGDSKGLELINSIFPYFRLIPGIVAAPGWSHDPEVAAVMTAKVKNISGVFWGMAVADIPTDEVTKYTDAPNWKNQNNYSDNMLISCWPKVALTDKKFHLSTQLIGVLNRTDANHDDIPYKSPSNESLQATGMILNDGKEIMLGIDNAAYLNGQGIVTGLNFIGGWKAWGNRTSIYPANTDPKDSFIAIRRMFNWINNTLITTFWNKIDEPTNKRLIETIVNSANVWLNGLTARQYILGGRVEFNRDENPLTDLMDGIIKFHVYTTPPPPAREIDFIQEYDVNYLNTLFGEG